MWHRNLWRQKKHKHDLNQNVSQKHAEIYENRQTQHNGYATEVTSVILKERHEFFCVFYKCTFHNFTYIHLQPSSLKTQLFIFLLVIYASFTRFTFTIGIQKALKAKYTCTKHSNFIVLLLQEPGLGCIKELYYVQRTCSFRIIFTLARLKYHNFLTLQSSVHPSITASSTY